MSATIFSQSSGRTIQRPAYSRTALVAHLGEMQALRELRASFAGVPARIVLAVFTAYLARTGTTDEAIRASRQRLTDALAA